MAKKQTNMQVVTQNSTKVAYSYLGVGFKNKSQFGVATLQYKQVLCCCSNCN